MLSLMLRLGDALDLFNPIPSHTFNNGQEWLIYIARDLSDSGRNV
jgi:hypothetical protein